MKNHITLRELAKYAFAGSKTTLKVVKDIAATTFAVVTIISLLYIALVIGQ